MSAVFNVFVIAIDVEGVIHCWRYNRERIRAIFTSSDSISYSNIFVSAVCRSNNSHLMNQPTALDVGGGWSKNAKIQQGAQIQ